MTGDFPPERQFVPLAAVEALEKRERYKARMRPENVVPMSSNNYHPFGSLDGVIEPNAWDGAAVPLRHWLVRNIIPTGEVTMLTGNGGEGKSLVTMQLLIAAATGSHWLGRPVKQMRALGVYCEDDKDELHRRTNNILNGERVEFSALDGLTLICRKGKDTILFEAQFNDMTGQFTPAFQRLRSTAIDLGAQVIVLDSLYDFFGGNENSKTQVKQFANGLAELAYDINGSVILVGHPSLSGMGSGSGTSGSTAWHNAVRSRLYLHRKKLAQWEIDKNENARGDLILQPMKANYAAPEDAIKLIWEEGRFVPVVDPRDPPPHMFGNDQ